MPSLVMPNESCLGAQASHRKESAFSQLRHRSGWKSFSLFFQADFLVSHYFFKNGQIMYVYYCCMYIMQNEPPAEHTLVSWYVSTTLLYVYLAYIYIYIYYKYCCTYAYVYISISFRTFALNLMLEGLSCFVLADLCSDLSSEDPYFDLWYLFLVCGDLRGCKCMLVFEGPETCHAFSTEAGYVAPSRRVFFVGAWCVSELSPGLGGITVLVVVFDDSEGARHEKPIYMHIDVRHHVFWVRVFRGWFAVVQAPTET